MNDFIARLRANPMLAAGVAGLIWIMPMLLFRGAHGITALMNAVSFMVAMLVITIPFRTISLRTVASMLLMGGGAMGIALLVAWFNTLIFGNGAIREIVQPPLEEFLYLLPVAIVLFRWRYSAVWTLGACDVLLMLAACGAGFGMAEEAAIRQKLGWTEAFAWLPVAELAGDRIRGYHLANGHAEWAALAGACLGIALVFRNRREIAIPIAIAGIGLGTMDHLTLNMWDKSEFGFGAFKFLLGGGYVTLIAFIAAVVAALVVDWMVLYGKLRPSWVMTEPPVKDMTSAGWAARLDWRSFVFAAHYLDKTPEKDKWMPQRMLNYMFHRLAGRKAIADGKLVAGQPGNVEPEAQDFTPGAEAPPTEDAAPAAPEADK